MVRHELQVTATLFLFNWNVPRFYNIFNNIGVKYVIMQSAPARRIDVITSITAEFKSIAPLDAP